MSHIFSLEATRFELSIDEVWGNNIFIIIKLLTAYFAMKVAVYSKFSNGVNFKNMFCLPDLLKWKLLSNLEC